MEPHIVGCELFFDVEGVVGAVPWSCQHFLRLCVISCTWHRRSSASVCKWSMATRGSSCNICYTLDECLGGIAPHKNVLSLYATSSDIDWLLSMSNKNDVTGHIRWTHTNVGLVCNQYSIREIFNFAPDEAKTILLALNRWWWLCSDQFKSDVQGASQIVQSLRVSSVCPWSMYSV